MPTYPSFVLRVIGFASLGSALFASALLVSTGCSSGVDIATNPPTNIGGNAGATSTGTGDSGSNSAGGSAGASAGSGGSTGASGGAGTGVAGSAGAGGGAGSGAGGSAGRGGGAGTNAGGSAGAGDAGNDAGGAAGTGGDAGPNPFQDFDCQGLTDQYQQQMDLASDCSPGVDTCTLIAMWALPCDCLRYVNAAATKETRLMQQMKDVYVSKNCHTDGCNICNPGPPRPASCVVITNSRKGGRCQ